MAYVPRKHQKMHNVRLYTSVIKAGEGSWVLMSRLTQCIQRLSEVETSAVLVSDMLEQYPVVSGLDIKYLSSFTKNTSDTLRRVIQELLELQQVQDLVLATRQGEV